METNWGAFTVGGDFNEFATFTKTNTFKFSWG